MSDFLEVGEEIKVLKTGNDELDRKIGGFPLPTLALIEGDNGAGKSVLVQQVVSGALANGLSVLYITTENTPKSLVLQMTSLFSEQIEDFYLNGKLDVFTIHVRGVDWNDWTSKYYLEVLYNYIQNDEKRSIFIVDSLTYLLTYAAEVDVLNFFSACRNLVDSSYKSLFLTLHRYALSSELLMRIRSICDAHIKLEIKEMGSKTLRTLTISKLKGADKSTGLILSFDVEPGIGIKVLPFSRAKA